MARSPQLPFLDQCQEFVVFCNGFWNLSTNTLFNNMVFVRGIQSPSEASHPSRSSIMSYPMVPRANSHKGIISTTVVSGHLISNVCALLSIFSVKAYDSQAYRNMDMKRERISCTFYAGAMLLSLDIGFIFVRAAMVGTILQKTLRF